MFLNNGHFLPVKSVTVDTCVAASFEDQSSHNRAYVNIVFDETQRKVI